MNAPRARRVRIKICGITNREDAEMAIDLGADALGFNTWKGSKRYIDLEKEASWIAALPPFVTKVALLVNTSLSETERIARLSFIDSLQLHGDEDGAFCAAVQRLGRPFIKALRVRTAEDFSNLSEYHTGHFLIDAHVPGLFGGTGVQVHTNLAADFRRQHPQLALILAGGLKPENVREAVLQADPYAVDVSSGVEARAGKKEASLVSEFIAAVREAEECRSIK